MASSLLESLSGLVGPSLVSRVAGQLGESQQSVSTGMQSGFAAILAGLVNKATDSGTMQEVAGLVTSQGGVPAEPSSAPTTAASPESASLLSTVFGGNTSGIAGVIAQNAGLKPSSASSILAMAAPLVLGVLGKSSGGGTVNTSTLSSTLLAQKDSILAALPAGLGGMLGISGLGDLGSAGYAKLSDTIAAPAIPRVTMPSASAGNRWLMPLLALLVILLLLWAFFGRNRSAATAPVSADTTQNVTAPPNAAAGAAADLGAFVKQKLPDGTELNIPSNGVESHLLAFLNDANRPVTDTLWFNFDRLNFETGSSKLKPESSEQLANIAAILKAYPSVDLKIGGYTDNTGNAAANMKLSQDRANAVKTDLIGRGTADSRLAAEGYGDAHPVADNATETGRAQNRRIAMRVTKK